MTPARYYWSVFLKRLPYFLIVATLIGAASVIVATTLPPLYVSETELIVESPQIPDELAPSTARIPAQEQLQIVEQRLLTRANLLDIANKLEVFDNLDEMSPDRVVQAMRARTTVSLSGRRGGLPLMQISFEASSGTKAAGVLNEYLTLIQQEDSQSRKGRAAQTQEFFEQEVERLNKELAERSSRILSFKTENADALPESMEYRLTQQTRFQERLGQIEREISSLTEQRERLITVFEATGQVGGVGGSASTPEQQKLENLRAQLNDALAVYSSENPRVKMLKARIAQVEEVVQLQPDPEDDNEFGSTGNSLLDVQLVELTAREEVLKEQRDDTVAQLEKLNDTIARTPKNAIRLDELQLEYENVQSQYNTAVDRLSRASTGERIELMSRGQRISVIEPPATPREPTKPNRILIAGGGGFFGILMGLGIVFLLEFVNRSIRRPEDLVSRLGVTPLATIPYVQTAGETTRRKIVRAFWVLTIVLGVPVAVYLVHIYYQPLDIVASRIMDKLGTRW